MKNKTLEYGRTFNVGKYESERITLTVDLDGTEDLVEALKTTQAQVFHLHEVGRLLEESKAIVESIPRIDLAKLEEQPWTKWHKDEQGNHVPANEGEPGWIKNPAYFTGFEAPQVQLELSKALTKTNGKLELGQYVFSFSGKDQMFITRQPKK